MAIPRDRTSKPNGYEREKIRRAAERRLLNSQQGPGRKIIDEGRPSEEGYTLFLKQNSDRYHAAEQRRQARLRRK